MMDLMQEAILLGFSGAAVMDTKELVFVPEYRTFCEENLCGCYNVNPACPPESGTVEEMKQRALSYEKTLVLQTMQEDLHDPAEYKKAKLLQNKMTEELAEKIKADGKTDLLIMSAFVPEYRTFCEENLCGCYNVNPACPPESGTVEEMKQRALSYEKTLVLQTMQEDLHDPAEYKKAKLLQNKMTEELAEKIKADGKTDLLIMSAGPYKHNSCMSAYCVDAQKMADAAGMLCWTDDGMVRYFSQILFHE